MFKDKKGQTLVEFALLAPLFFILIFGMVDLGWMFYVNLTMQHAVSEGARYFATRRSDLEEDQKEEALIEKIRGASMGLYDKNLHEPKDPSVAVVWPGSLRETGGGPGAWDDIIVVSLTYTSPLLTPLLKPFIDGGEYTFTVESTNTTEHF